jgi:hypothetical protein
MNAEDKNTKKPRLLKKRKEKERRRDTNSHITIAGLPCNTLRSLKCGTKTDITQR